MPYFNHYAMPLVSVLMPVYNGEKYIKEAIDSILCQTFTDFELLICNDASTDRSMDIVRQYRDSRIKVLENQTNSGIVYTRNKLFTEAQGTYLSIMDCDDIAQKQKLEKQGLFLENHPACGICGTWARKINENLETVGHIQMPEEDADIRVNLLFQSSFVQSSVVLRKKLLSDLLYRQEFPVAEDYDLWERLSHLTQMHNIPEFLLYYRWHQQNTSQNQENLLAQKRDLIIARQLSRMLSFTPTELQTHIAIGNLLPLPDSISVSQAGQWLKKLLASCQTSLSGPSSRFHSFIWYRWVFYCIYRKYYLQGLFTPLVSFRPAVMLHTFRLIMRKIF